MLWIVREAAIYYFSHAQFKAYLPSAPNIVSWKVQFECDTLKHKQWEINQVSVHCTLVTESCSLDIASAYIFKLKKPKCKIHHFVIIGIILKSIIPKLYMMYTCIQLAHVFFFLLSKGDCSCLRLINELSFIHSTSSFNSSTGSSKCTTTRNFSCRSQSHSSLGM